MSPRRSLSKDRDGDRMCDLCRGTCVRTGHPCKGHFFEPFTSSGLSSDEPSSPELLVCSGFFRTRRFRGCAGCQPAPDRSDSSRLVTTDGTDTVHSPASFMKQESRLFLTILLMSRVTNFQNFSLEFLFCCFFF